MVDQTSSLVRTAALRKSALSLTKPPRGCADRGAPLERAHDP
jgi:hypothetical protein